MGSFTFQNEAELLGRVTSPPPDELLATTDHSSNVTSIMPRLLARAEAAQRAATMLDLTAYMFRHYRISRERYTDPASYFVFEMLWGVKEVVSPESDCDYLPGNVEKTLHLHGDMAARQAVALILPEQESIEQIARTTETRPWIGQFGLYVHGLPNVYEPVA